MRKIILSIITSLLLIWTVYFMIEGSAAIGVKGFLGLKEENEMLEKRIETLNKTINNTYKGALVTLDSQKDDLIDIKTDYENQAALSSMNNKEAYNIELLWTSLVNFAKDENITIKMEVTNANVSDLIYISKDDKTRTATLCDLKLTASGIYDGITNFIYDIEKDATLGFKIDNFSMSGVGELIEATFECREILVDLGEKKGEQSQSSTSPDMVTQNPSTSTIPTETNTVTQNSTQTTENTVETQTSTETSSENKTATDLFDDMLN